MGNGQAKAKELTHKSPEHPAQDHERKGLLHVVEDGVPAHVVRLLEAGVDVAQLVHARLQAGDVQALFVRQLAVRVLGHLAAAAGAGDRWDPTLALALALDMWFVRSLVFFCCSYLLCFH